MTDIVFARPRHEYDSYRDLWRLVELSGFPLIYADEIDAADVTKTFIYSGPDAALSWPGAKAQIIYYMIEWYTDYEQREGVADTWHPDAMFASRIGARYIPLGSHPDLAQPFSYCPKEYDIIHLQYIVPRRNDVLYRLHFHHAVKIAPGGWGDERHEQLLKSRAMLHVHQHEDIPALAPLRAALAAAYHMPVFSEQHWEVPHLPAGVILSGSHQELPGLIKAKLGRDGLNDHGEWLHRVLCDEYRFDKVIGASV